MHASHGFNTGLGFDPESVPFQEYQQQQQEQQAYSVSQSNNNNNNNNNHAYRAKPNVIYNFEDKFQFPQSKERYAYNLKWKELENYLNKFYAVQMSVVDSHAYQHYDTLPKMINFDKHLVCYIRMDFGLKETRIYTTHEKIPSIFADYITLNYCDEFVLMWIISWFGYDSWEKYINYCKQYGVFLEELVCLGVSFNIDEGSMQIIYMDGNDKNSVRRVKLPWNKEAYGFVIDRTDETNQRSAPSDNYHQFQLNQQQQQQQRFVKLKFKSSSLNKTKQVVNSVV